jgi:hypothetical protein
MTTKLRASKSAPGLLFFFFVVLAFELRAYTLKPLHQPYFLMAIFEIGSYELPRLASNHELPDLYE